MAGLLGRNEFRDWIKALPLQVLVVEKRIPVWRAEVAIGKWLEEFLFM